MQKGKARNEYWNDVVTTFRDNGNTILKATYTPVLNMIPTMVGIGANQAGAAGMAGGKSGGAGAQGGMPAATGQGGAPASGGAPTGGGSPVPMGGGAPGGMPQGK